jgi:maltose O-acetyltransferase
MPSAVNPIPPLLEAFGRSLPYFAAPRIRRLAMQGAGFKMGRTSTFWGWPTIAGSGDVRTHLTIGEHCGFNVHCYFELEGHITIGNHVSVGHEVMFLTRSHDMSDGRRRAGDVTPKPIAVEDGAWLGARCVIMPGVRVGAGAVVGASVVVSEDVPEQTLVMGTQRISLARWR